MTINLSPAESADPETEASPALTFEERLGQLYQRQEQLSRRTDPEGEREYNRVVAEIVKLTSTQ